MYLYVCIHTHTHTHTHISVASELHIIVMTMIRETSCVLCLLCLQSEERALWPKKEHLDSNPSFGETLLQEPRPTGGARQALCIPWPYFPPGLRLSHYLISSRLTFLISDLEWDRCRETGEQLQVRESDGDIEGLGRAEDNAACRGGVARCSLSYGGKGGEQRRGALCCALTWPHRQAKPDQGSFHFSAPLTQLPTEFLHCRHIYHALPLPDHGLGDEHV